MSQLPDALLDPLVYSHQVEHVTLVETHMSWVFLTGTDVYKVKKPVCFDFADFSTLHKRHFFCMEEVRCNRAFAGDLYVGVVPIVARRDGTVRVAPVETMAGDLTIDYAVHMLEFDGALQADRLLDQGRLSIADMHAFGGRLAAQHAQLAELDAAYDPGQAMLDNFATLRALQCTQPFAAQLDALEAQANGYLKEQGEYLLERRDGHFVRECHGDLHLSNLAKLGSGITAFDCLEFDQSLRHIDVWCDAAFLFMDCCVRDRADLAYAFVDGYLDVSGDYAGVQLLPMFAAYRSVVRAKIAGLRFEQSAEPQVREKLQRHLAWPQAQQQRGVGRLLITCGMSGSGKSYWTDQLVPALAALRLRSDVLRKRQHGLDPLAGSASNVGEGLYQADASAQVYDSLADYAATLLCLGETVIIDAACLKKAQRTVLYEAASRVNAVATLLHFTAPLDELRSRINARKAAGNSPSEADSAVLDWQLDEVEPPAEPERVVELDTTRLTLKQLVKQIKESAYQD